MDMVGYLLEIMTTSASMAEAARVLNAMARGRRERSKLQQAWKDVYDTQVAFYFIISCNSNQQCNSSSICSLVPAWFNMCNTGTINLNLNLTLIQLHVSYILMFTSLNHIPKPRLEPKTCL